MNDPIQLLRDLVHALDNAFICNLQSTAEWNEQLKAAKKFLIKLDRMEDEE